jgi:hypothetical protein
MHRKRVQVYSARALHLRVINALDVAFGRSAMRVFVMLDKRQ